MNLFNLKAMKRNIKPAPIPADHLAALDAWALKENALHEELIA